VTANDVPRKLWLSQEGHVDPFDYRRDAWVDTLHRRFDYWLQGENNYLSLTNTQTNKLMFLSPPLEHDQRISGTPVVDIQGALSKTQTNLSAFLVDYGGGVLRVPRTVGDGVQNLTTRSCWGDSTATDSACYLDVIERTTTPTMNDGSAAHTATFMFTA